MPAVSGKWLYLPHEQQQWPTLLFDAVGLSCLLETPSLIGAGGTPLTPGQSAGSLSAEAAAALGLDASVQVAAGTIDAHCGAVGIIGCGAADVIGPLAIVGGTSACHLRLTEQPAFVEGVWVSQFSSPFCVFGDSIVLGDNICVGYVYVLG